MGKTPRILRVNVTNYIFSICKNLDDFGAITVYREGSDKQLKRLHARFGRTFSSPYFAFSGREKESGNKAALTDEAYLLSLLTETRIWLGRRKHCKKVQSSIVRKHSYSEYKCRNFLSVGHTETPLALIYIIKPSIFPVPIVATLSLPYFPSLPLPSAYRHFFMASFSWQKYAAPHSDTCQTANKSSPALYRVVKLFGDRITEQNWGIHSVWTPCVCVQSGLRPVLMFCSRTLQLPLERIFWGERGAGDRELGVGTIWFHKSNSRRAFNSGARFGKTPAALNSEPVMSSKSF